LVLPLLLIISNVVVNRVWHVERYGGKLRSHPRRAPGGFLWESLRQALALGFKVMTASARGQDAAGDFLEATLRDTGADVNGLRTVPLPTATAEVIVKGEERTIFIEEGTPTASWSPQLADLEYFERAGWILAGGTLGDDILSWVLCAARDRKKPVALNPSRARSLMDLDLRGVELLQISRADLPNFGLNSHAPPRDVAAVFQSLGANVVSITDDAKPEWAFTSCGRAVMIPSVPDRLCLFPTGTGDASFIGRLAGLIWFGQDSLDDSLGQGSLAGAFFIENGRPGTWAELEALGREWPARQRRVRRVRRDSDFASNPPIPDPQVA
jgi:sugar/nucleoside kinase (ribokinase family)